MEKMSKIDTLCVHAGYTPGKGDPRQLPVIQSTTFKYETSDQMGRLFDLEESGYFYSRLQNPTCDAVAARIAALEGGVGKITVLSAACVPNCWACSVFRVPYPTTTTPILTLYSLRLLSLQNTHIHIQCG